MADERYDLSFLGEWGADASRGLTAAESAALRRVRAELGAADAIIVHTGGKAGRLGEAIIGTAFIEGTLQMLTALGRQHTPVTLLIDSAMVELLPAAEYRARYWPEIVITAIPSAEVEPDSLARFADGAAQRPLLLDFHGQHDGTPSFLVSPLPSGGGAGEGAEVILANLNRVALRSYAARGPDERYAAFFRDLFTLPAGSLSGAAVQPCIYVPAADAARFPELARAFGLDADALLIVCFFQSVVAAKVYERWDEVMALISEHVHTRFPGRTITYFVACGPDTAQPVHCEDLAAILGGFTGSGGNSRVVVATTPSLRDLAVLLQRATLTLANDTGPGHLSGALGIPTITPYLPGTLYSMTVWAATRAHRGVTLDTNPYTYAELEAAVFASNTAIINAISPEQLAALAEAALASFL